MASVEESIAEIERAERRLAERAEGREAARARARKRKLKLKRRQRGAASRPDQWRPPRRIVPACAGAGSVLVVGTLIAAGGDLGHWPRTVAYATLLLEGLGPPLVAGWLARREEPVVVFACAALTLGIELVVCFGIAFRALAIGGP